MVNEIHELGKQGEIMAANYLRKCGYEILKMNFANELGYRRGELDIVAKDTKSNEIVFVEVKSRQKSFRSVDPLRAISRQKYQRLTRIISTFINSRGLQDSQYRLDAVAVEFDLATRRASLVHVKHIYF